MPRDASSVLEEVDRALLVSIFADVLGRGAGDEWRLRDRIVTRMGVLAAARLADAPRFAIVVDAQDLHDLAESAIKPIAARARIPIDIPLTLLIAPPVPPGGAIPARDALGG